MVDSDIVQAWRSFDDDRRKSLLGKMSTEQKSNLRHALEADTTVPPARSSPPGFLTRFAEAVGLPTSKQDVEAMQPSTAEKIGGPAITFGKMAYFYGKNLYSEGKNAIAEIWEAGKNIDQGDKSLSTLGENWGKAGAAASEFVLHGLLGPVGGGAIQAWGEDLQTNNWSGAAGDAFGTLVNALLLKSARPLGAEGKVNKIAFAADLKKGIEDVKAVLPDIEKASKGSPPTTLPKLLDTVNQAKRDMNTQSGLAMQPIRGQQIVPTKLADYIKNRITPDMIQTAEGRAQEGMFKKASLDFQKPWTFEQLDALRMRWGSELSGYWSMNPAEKTSYLKAHPEVAVQVEVVNGIKEIVYPEMDRAVGKPTGYFADLKGRQSTLIDMQKSLETQVDRLKTETGKVKGAPRFGMQHVSMYMATSAEPHPGFSLHKLNPFKPNPEAMANKAVSRAFTGSRKAQTALTAGAMLRTLQGKPPGVQKRELQEMRSSNPNMPTGEER